MNKLNPEPNSMLLLTMKTTKALRLATVLSIKAMQQMSAEPDPNEREIIISNACLKLIDLLLIVNNLIINSEVEKDNKSYDTIDIEPFDIIDLNLDIDSIKVTEQLLSELCKSHDLFLKHQNRIYENWRLLEKIVIDAINYTIKIKK